MGISTIFTNLKAGRDPFLTKKALEERLAKAQAALLKEIRVDVQGRHNKIAEEVAAKQPYCR